MPGLPARPCALHLVPRVADAPPCVPQAWGLPAGATVVAMTFAELVRTLDLPATSAAEGPASLVVWDAWHAQLRLEALLAAAHGPAADESVPEVYDALQRLRRAGLDAALLGRAVAGLSTEHAAAAAPTWTLLRDYEGTLCVHRAQDAASPWRRALAVGQRADWPGALSAVHTVLVDASLQVTGPQLALVEAIAQGPRRVVVALPFAAEQPEENPWAEALLAGIEASRAPNLEVRFVGDGHHNIDGEDQSAGGANLGREAGGQGGDSGTAGSVVANPHAPPPHRPDLEVVQCAPGEATVDHVVATVAGWVDAGIAPPRIAVVLPRARAPLWQRAAHEQRLRLGLARAGLPVEPGEPPRLADHPAGTLWHHALAVAAALAEPQPDGGATGVLSAAVPLVSLGAVAAALCAPPADGVPRGSAEPELAGGAGGVLVAEAAVDLGEVAHVLWRLGPRRLSWDALTQTFASLEGEVTLLRARQWSRALQQLLAEALLPLAQCTTLAEACGVLAALLDAASVLGGNAVMDASVQARVRDALGALRRADGAVGAPPRSFAQVQRWLHRLLAHTTLVAQPNHGGVALRTPEACAGGRFTRALLVGANPGIFPRPRRANPHLPDALLRALPAHGGPRLLPTAGVAADAPLAFDAEEQAQWTALRAAAPGGLHVVVLESADDAEDGACAPVRHELARLGQAAPTPATQVHARPWSQQPDAAALLRAASVARPPLVPAEAPRARFLARRLHRQAAGQAALGRGVAARVEAAWLATDHRATALDQLARCRFKYHAEASLGLRALAVPSLTASARLRGSAMHRALEVTLRALINAPGGLAAQRQDPAAAMAHAEAAYQNALTDILPPHHVHPVLYAPLRDEVWRAVSFRLEADLANPAANPLALEYRFNNERNAAAPLEVPEPEGGGGRTARVRGSIDRIDLAAGGDAGGVLWTYDYKRTVARRNAHRHLQLGLYGLVATRDFGADVAGHGAAWLTLAGRDAGKAKPAKELFGTPAELAHGVAHDLWTRLGPWLEGDVTPDPDKDACRTCDYADLCHYAGPEDDDDGEEPAT